MKRIAFYLTITMLMVGGFTFAQETAPGNTQLSPEKIIEKSQLAFYYAGKDMKAKVTMELIDKDGGRRTRVMTLLRRDESEGGNQKYFIYFHEPGDVRRMVFMVWKYPEKEDDRWLFVPAVDLVKRIAADDKRSSFVGSDFTYEDVSGRDVDADRHSFLKEEKLNGKDCYVIESTPESGADYIKRISWIDKETYLPIQETYYDAQEQLFRIFTADRIERTTTENNGESQTWPTVMKRTMKNVKTGHRTEVTLNAIRYNVGLKDNDFSERRMRRPPIAWIR